MEFELQLKAYAGLVDARLEALLPAETARPTELGQAMRYSCLGPGKRLRPALCLASAEAAGGEAEAALNAACAVEMVHCFSLIHDDLPALDNDDLRRGRATCHVAYGEAIAILAGDALFSLAFETLAAPKLGLAPRAELRVDCIRVLTQAAGMDGLVAGEAADLLSEGGSPDQETVHFIHTRKTGSLISAACEIGARISSSDLGVVRRLAQYGSAVGLAFQIADDILNETSTPEELGKSAGSDRERKKATYPALFGVEESRRRGLLLAEQAQAGLKDLPGPTGFLGEMAVFAVERLR